MNVVSHLILQCLISGSVYEFFSLATNIDSFIKYSVIYSKFKSLLQFGFINKLDFNLAIFKLSIKKG